MTPVVEMRIAYVIDQFEVGWPRFDKKKSTSMTSRMDSSKHTSINISNES